ncbi:MAG: hypothetical protein SynsKO_45300 [Synoicihabitans sp.]
MTKFYGSGCRVDGALVRGFRAKRQDRARSEPDHELEVSHMTKARTEMMRTSPFARSARQHRPVYWVRGAKRFAQSQPKDPPAKWVIQFYPTTVR